MLYLTISKMKIFNPKINNRFLDLENDINVGYKFLRDYSRENYIEEKKKMRKKIEKRAYQLYCENKSRTSDENWFMAEKEILNEKKVKWNSIIRIYWI